jgi:hypothetical protein
MTCAACGRQRVHLPGCAVWAEREAELDAAARRQAVKPDPFDPAHLLVVGATLLAQVRDHGVDDAARVDCWPYIRPGTDNWGWSPAESNLLTQLRMLEQRVQVALSRATPAQSDLRQLRDRLHQVLGPPIVTVREIAVPLPQSVKLALLELAHAATAAGVELNVFLARDLGDARLEKLRRFSWWALRQRGLL